MCALVSAPQSQLFAGWHNAVDHTKASQSSPQRSMGRGASLAVAAARSPTHPNMPMLSRRGSGSGAQVLARSDIATILRTTYRSANIDQPKHQRSSLPSEDYFTVDQCPSRNPNSTPPSGPAATSCAAAWMPASTRTTSSSCCSSSTSATSTPACPTRRSPSRRAPASRTWSRSRASRDIGDQINKKIIAPLANANKLSDLPDFNDADQARQRQGDGGPAHQPDRHLREHGARLLARTAPRATTSWATPTNT